MKIREMHIEHFGKWQNKRIRLEKDLVSFVGNNEAGKSTIQDFINFVLFGKDSALTKRYKPSKKQPFSGSLLLETDDDQWLIKREDKKVTIVDSSGSIRNESLLSELLFGINRQQFNAIFAFNVDDLYRLTAVEKTDLQRHLLSVGETGNDHLIDLMDSLKKNADAYYTPKASKREINLQLNQLKEQSELLEQLKEQQSTYKEHELAVARLTQRLIDNQTIQQNLEQQVAQLTLDKSLYPIYIKQQQLQQATQDKNGIVLSSSEINGVYRNATQLDYLRQQLAIYQTKKQQTQALTLAEDEQFFIDNSVLIKEVCKSLPNVEQQLGEYAKLEYQKSHMVEQQEETLKKWHYESMDSVPDATIFETATYRELEQRQQQLRQQKQQLQIESNQAHKKLLEANNQYDALVNWRLDVKEDAGTIYLIGAISAVVLAIGTGIGINWIVAALFFIIGGALATAYVSKKRVHDQVNRDKVQRHTQVTFWKSQVEAAQQDVSNSEEKLLENQEALDALEVELSNWRLNHQLPETFVITPQVIDALNQLHNDQLKIHQYSTQLKIQEEKLVILSERFAFFESQVVCDYAESPVQKLRMVVRSFKQFVDETRYVEQKVAQTVEKQREISQQLDRIQQQLTNLEAIQKEMFHKTHVANMAEFEQYVQQVQITLNNQEKAQTYAKQLADRLPALQQYKDETAIDTQLQAIIKQQEANRQEQGILVSEKAYHMQRINDLRTNGNWQSEQLRYEMLRENLIESVKEWGANQLAAHLIDKLLNDNKVNNLDALLRQASGLFERLTDERYRQIVFRQDALTLIDRDFNEFALIQLSKGTVEQLYIALRLAFIIEVGRLIQLPIIIDDAFVNFDKKRELTMYTILSELVDNNHQVLYFSYSNDMAKFLEETQEQLQKVDL